MPPLFRLTSASAWINLPWSSLVLDDRNAHGTSVLSQPSSVLSLPADPYTKKRPSLLMN